MFKLMNTVSITLVNEDNNQKPLNYNAFLKQAIQEYNGYTLTNQEGGWWSDEEDIMMIEKSQKLDLSFEELDSGKLQVISNVANFLFDKDFGGQESIFVQLDGKPMLVFPGQVAEMMEFIESHYNVETKETVK